jgi:hypothetical protein
LKSQHPLLVDVERLKFPIIHVRRRSKLELVVVAIEGRDGVAFDGALLGAGFSIQRLRPVRGDRVSDGEQLSILGSELWTTIKKVMLC